MIRHLYVHIPFCQRRCSYCDFNTFANSEHIMADYTAALATQIVRMGSGEWLPAPAAPTSPAPLYTRIDQPAPLVRAELPLTVFLGGGTPTALPLPLLEQVMAACNEVVPLAHAEVTSEANPGTVLDEDYLRGMRAMGINRISMGVQSLDDQVLRTLGRIHTAAEARTSYEVARRAGFETINLDFIFGLPGQTLEQWRRTLDEVATWGVDHFSLYSLILEPDTPLTAQVDAGRIAVPDDDLTGEMFELAAELLGAAGYVQYEISNWALPSALSSAPTVALPAHAARHNVAYWLNADYLGCGAGAHSHVGGMRWSDLRGLRQYISAIEQGRRPTENETQLSALDIASETMIMGLRLTGGVGEEHFLQRCGRPLDDLWGPQLAELITLGLIERTPDAVRLTPRGKMLGNQVFLRFA